MNVVIVVELDENQLKPLDSAKFAAGFASALQSQISGSNAVKSVLSRLCTDVVVWDRPNDRWLQVELQNPLLNINSMLLAESDTLNIEREARKVRQTAGTDGACQDCSISQKQL
jgi:hypothetical protein